MNHEENPKIQKIRQIQMENTLSEDLYRARSFTIGSAYGGMIEIGLRGDNSHLWFVMNHGEAAEFAIALGALAGLDMSSVKPLEGKMAWRQWNEEKKVEENGNS